MGKEQLQLLESDGMYISVPEGISMRPMIKAGRDVVLVEKIKSMPKRYDLVMYIRGEDIGVIHRVIHYRDGTYIICGDNCWQLEYVAPEQIKGIVTKYCRKGKWRSVDYLPYRIYVRLWVDLLFLKRPVFFVRDKTKRILVRIRNALFRRTPEKQ